MADYKRMISYMYQYENGIKKSNVGYARIEAKNEQCKITLHMQLLGQSDSVFPTYLIHRDDQELIYIGDSLLKNQAMDSKFIMEEANIKGTGYSLTDMGGLIIFLNNNVIYASGWDDKPMIANELLNAMKPKRKISEDDAAAEKTLRSDVNIMNMSDRESGLSALDKTVNSMESGLEKGEKDGPEIMSLEEELKIPKYTLPRGWKTVEMFQKPAYEKEIAPEVSISRQKELDPPESLQQIEEDQPVKEYKQAENNMTEPVINEEEEPESNQTAKYLFDNYPRIYPFEDSEIQLCVKIEPKDIGLLPKDIWSLSGNSFLMHGFYCYHHLIFAKKKDDENGYILGIPGIYHNREQFMARMFGFESFKSIRKRELRQGDFGYWYLPVNL